jgi:hypothetical protein
MLNSEAMRNGVLSDPSLIGSK